MPEKKLDKTEPESELWENIVAVVVVALIVIIAYFAIQYFGNKPQEQVEQRYPIPMGNDPVLGDINAPITIVEYSDFQCDHCAQWHAQVYPQLKEQYIDTGMVRFIFKDFPIEIIHPDAIFIHEAAGCAYEQKKFWEFHDAVFENFGSVTPTFLNNTARDLGLNMVEFNACRLNRTRYTEIGADLREGTSYSVSGTPTFFINGRKIVGNEPIETFRKIIEEEK